MEPIDNWEDKNPIPQKPPLPPPPPPRGRAGAKPPASAPTKKTAEVITSRLSSFEPDVLNVQFYDDVGYPWVQVVFESCIDPSVALRIGDVLADVVGTERVYFNSLRPEAVYFLLMPDFDQAPDLPASRYGTLLAEIKKAWAKAAESEG